MSRSRYKYSGDNRPHFLTCTIVGWLPIFSNSKMIDIIINSLKFLQKTDRIQVFGFVIMIDHLHLIASSENLSKEISHFKSFTARQIIQLLKDENDFNKLNIIRTFRKKFRKDRQFQVWQEGSYPKVIMNRKMMSQKLNYIHYNPVKKGYVSDPLDWNYSSARNYRDLKSLLDVNVNWLE
jgi:REP element-mobilizing transposase RayT